MLEVRVSFPTGALEEKAKLLQDALKTEDILDEAGAFLLNRIRTRFLAETDPFGEKWIPSKAGIRRRARGGTGTLFATGRLFRSIQLAATGSDQRAIQSDVEYGKRHQTGDGQIKRMFLGFNDEDAALVEKLIARRIERAIEG